VEILKESRRNAPSEPTVQRSIPCRGRFVVARMWFSLLEIVMPGAPIQRLLNTDNARGCECAGWPFSVDSPCEGPQMR